MPMTFHKHRKHGEVSEKINRAASQFKNIIDNVLINLAPEFLSILIALVIAFTINTKLSLILILALIIYIFILWRAVPGMAKIQSKMYELYSRAYGRAYDALGNVQEIKQATTEQFEERRLLDYFVKKAAASWLAVKFNLAEIARLAENYYNSYPTFHFRVFNLSGPKRRTHARRTGGF